MSLAVGGSAPLPVGGLHFIAIKRDLISASPSLIRVLQFSHGRRTRHCKNWSKHRTALRGMAHNGQFCGYVTAHRSREAGGA